MNAKLDKGLILYTTSRSNKKCTWFTWAVYVPLIVIYYTYSSVIPLIQEEGLWRLYSIINVDFGMWLCKFKNIYLWVRFINSLAHTTIFKLAFQMNCCSPCSLKFLQVSFDRFAARNGRTGDEMSSHVSIVHVLMGTRPNTQWKCQQSHLDFAVNY